MKQTRKTLTTIVSVIAFPLLIHGAEVLGTNQCLKNQEQLHGKESAYESARSGINAINSSQKIPSQIANILFYGMKRSFENYLKNS